MEGRMSREIDEEHIFEEKVFVAVGKDFTKWKENLRWVLKNTNPHHEIVFLHVHQPATKIPMPHRVEQNELLLYRLNEKEKMNEELKSYIDNCKAYKFRDIKTTDNSDIAKGLIELIDMYKVKDLIMGATSDRNLSKAKRDTAPRSKNAIYVNQKADPLCRIRFVCKGELICIRERGQAELSLVQANRQLNIEMKKRSELEECFKKQSNELAEYKAMMDQTTSKLNESNELNNSLKSRIRQLEEKVSSLENKFTNTYSPARKAWA